MSTGRIEELNSKIDYEEGKIYWENNKGYTSKLIKLLTEKIAFIRVEGK